MFAVSLFDLLNLLLSLFVAVLLIDFFLSPFALDMVIPACDAFQLCLEPLCPIDSLLVGQLGVGIKTGRVQSVAIIQFFKFQMYHSFVYRQ